MYLEIIEKVRSLTGPMLEELHLVLVDVTIRRQGQDLFIEVIVDRPEGGITLDECSVVNRQLNDALDHEGAISENYFLEVSSPGLDRPLKTREDFLRVRNRNVRFHLSSKVNEKVEHAGIVKDVQEDQVIVSAQGEDISIPLETINKAVQVI